MDRRRFVPSPEGLEDRELMSLFGTTTVKNNAAQDVPVTFAQKELRIEHLPFYLNQMQPGRDLPHDLISQLQTDLTAIAGRLHKPGYQRLIAFNTDLRDVTPDTTLTVADAKILDHIFVQAISDTGATTQQVTNLENDMTNLTKVDSQSSQPIFLATNDYSAVLQTILGVGRPIQTPTAPQIALPDGIRVSPSLGKTTKPLPRLVGTYGAGATVGVFAGSTSGGFNSDGVTMQIIDNSGNVLGQAPIDPKNGNYRITLATPLTEGVNRLHVRAVDAEGHVSNPSETYFLKLLTKPGEMTVTGMATPAGPLGQ